MLTDSDVRKLKPSKQEFTAGAGTYLYVRVSPSGTKTWGMRRRVRGQQETANLGRWPAVSASKARKLAEGINEQIARGGSLRAWAQMRNFATGHAQVVTVDEFGARWMQQVVAKVRKDPSRIQRYLDRDVYPVIGLTAMRHVTAEQVQHIVFTRRDEGRPEAAATLRHLLKRMFEYAMACRIVDKNPIDLTPLKFVVKHKSRTRVLNNAEITKFKAQLCNKQPGYKASLALELILLTLCRKSELLQARWDQIDFNAGVWEVPAALSKTGMPHVVYLSTQARLNFRCLQSLAGKSEMVLPAKDSLTQSISPQTLNKAIARTKWGMPAFTPHDLRRTAATHLNEMGYLSDWIEKALNHSVKGVRGVYNRAQYAEQRKKMLQEWADFLETR